MRGRRPHGFCPPVDGPVTRGEVASLCPFDGAVVECELDGAALADLLAEAAFPHPGDRGWVQFHVSGARVRWTDANEVRSVGVGGDPLDPDRTYRVATAEYVVVVDDYPPLDWDAAVAEHDPQWRGLVAHARDGGLGVDREGRIDRVAARADAGAAATDEQSGH
ncbi:MAG: 5'-nucleotidase C-terminal domain-containing protein [Haloarculaceae archaeon]